MKAIFIAPGCKPVEVRSDFENFETMQAFVGGIFSCSALAENLAVYYHDEGLLEGLPPNVLSNGALLVGNLLVIRVDDAGDNTDTTEADLALVRDWLAKSKRVGHFEYDIPPMRIFTSRAEMQAAEPMPTPEPVAVDGCTIH